MNKINLTNGCFMQIDPASFRYRRWAGGVCAVLVLSCSTAGMAADIIEGEPATGTVTLTPDSNVQYMRDDETFSAETVSPAEVMTGAAESGEAPPPSLEQVIDRYVLQASAQLPVVLDELTRLDRVSREDGATLRYDFSITHTPRADLDEEAVRRILAGVANVGCKGHEQFLASGIRIAYHYTVEGAPIGAVSIDKEICGRTPVTLNDEVIRVVNPGLSPSSLAERIQRYIKRDSTGLPVMVDKTTRLDRVDQEGNSLNYHLTIMNVVRQEISARLVRATMLSMSDGACSAFEPLIREGGKVRYLLDLEDGPAGVLEIDQALCARQPLRLKDPALVTINVPEIPENLGEMITRHVEEASAGLPQMMTNILRLDRVHRVGSSMIQHDITVTHDGSRPVDRESLRALMLGMIEPGCRAYEWFISAGVKIKVDYSIDGERTGTLLLDQAVCERLPVKEDDPAAVVFN